VLAGGGDTYVGGGGNAEGGGTPMAAGTGTSLLRCTPSNCAFLDMASSVRLINEFR
jgi:hypothetical protein